MEKPAGRKARGCRGDWEGKGIPILGHPGDSQGGAQALKRGDGDGLELSQHQHHDSWPCPTSILGNTVPCHCWAPHLLGASVGPGQ